MVRWLDGRLADELVSNDNDDDDDDGKDDGDDDDDDDDGKDDGDDDDDDDVDDDDKKSSITFKWLTFRVYALIRSNKTEFISVMLSTHE